MGMLPLQPSNRAFYAPQSNQSVSFPPDALTMGAPIANPPQGPFAQTMPAPASPITIDQFSPQENAPMTPEEMAFLEQLLSGAPPEGSSSLAPIASAYPSSTPPTGVDPYVSRRVRKGNSAWGSDGRMVLDTSNQDKPVYGILKKALYGSLALATGFLAIKRGGAVRHFLESYLPNNNTPKVTLKKAKSTADNIKTTINTQLEDLISIKRMRSERYCDWSDEMLKAEFERLNGLQDQEKLLPEQVTELHNLKKIVGTKHPEYPGIGKLHEAIEQQREKLRQALHDELTTMTKKLEAEPDQGLQTNIDMLKKSLEDESFFNSMLETLLTKISKDQDKITLNAWQANQKGNALSQIADEFGMVMPAPKAVLNAEGKTVADNLRASKVPKPE